MNLTGVLPALRPDAGLAELVTTAPARGGLTITASVGVRAPMLAELATRAGRPLVVVVATGREADELAEALADSGQIDLIIGNHPHVPQPFELLDGGPDGEGMWVAYSLGNFISNQDEECCVPQTGTGLFMTATVVKPVDGPARVTGLEWTPMTVDRLGGQRVYPLTELLGGQQPDGLQLDSSTLESRMEGVEDVMAESSGAEFAERTEAPEATGDPAEVVPRSE